MSIRIAAQQNARRLPNHGLRREAGLIAHGEPCSAVCKAYFSALGKSWSWLVQDPVLRKIAALLTRQSFDCEPVVRIFLKSRCTASIRKSLIDPFSRG
jgi:hypothetical protein